MSGDRVVSVEDDNWDQHWDDYAAAVESNPAQDYRRRVTLKLLEAAGAPQRLLVTVEVWIDERSFAASDERAKAWDYDFLRTEVGALARGRRFNLQETFVREIYDLVAARRGVTALRVSTRKPDIYPDCAGVGVELSSF